MNQNIALLRANVKEMLNIASFRRWLKNQPKQQLVGFAELEDACPIANYCNHILNNSVNKLTVEEGYSFIELTGQGVIKIETPPWVMDFVKEADRYGKRKSEDLGSKIAPLNIEECLYILELLP